MVDMLDVFTRDAPAPIRRQIVLPASVEPRLSERKINLACNKKNCGKPAVRGYVLCSYHREQRIAQEARRKAKREMEEKTSG